MKIHRLEVKGFKSIAHLMLEDTSPFLVFAGANGAGKSNLVDALAFFGLVVKQGVKQALQHFGGFEQIHCFKAPESEQNSMLFALNISIESKRYEYELVLNALDVSPELIEKLIVDGKVIINRQPAKGTEVVLGENMPLQHLPDYSPELSALTLLSKNPLYQFLTNIRVFRIDPFAAKEPDSPSIDKTALDAQGKNVASMLSKLEKNEEFTEQVLEWLELIVPGMESIATEKQRLDSSTLLTFKEQGTAARFPAKLISDGTIYALCILTAVLSRAQSSGITIIEEPERGIHPKAIGELIQLMRDNSNTTHPIFITTHSESVVRNLELDELYFVSKINGRSVLKSASEAGIDKRKIPLDTAWLTNLFDGGLPW